MIIIDASENKQGSKLPKIEGCVVSSILEALTGADIMISPLDLPATTDALIRKHIENDALLVQRKTGMDLISSIGDRMNESLLRMKEIQINHIQAQCILLFCGKLEASAGGLAVIDDEVTKTPYMNVISAINKWIDRGGVYVNIDNRYTVDWIVSREKTIKSYGSEQIKFVVSGNLQELQGINDWRKTIATFPMIGIERANALRSNMIANGKDDTLIAGIIELTSLKKNIKTKGIGNAIHKACRGWLGLPEGWDISIIYEEKE